MDLATLRQSLPVTRHCCYLQTGSLGPNPVQEVEIMRQAMDDFQRSGPGDLKVLSVWQERAELARAKLALFLGVTAGEVAWTMNTSQGIRSVFISQGWSAGDEVVTSSLEHVSSRALWAGLQEIFGVRVRVVPIEDDDDEFLARLLPLLNRRTRMLFLSHVSCINGRRLPVARAAALARERGVLTVIDGAQAPGQLPVNVRELGADFYVGSAHKWLLGPLGLGFVVVTPEALPRYNPALVAREVSGELPANRPAAAARGEMGTADPGLRAGFAEVLDILAAIGTETIQAHTAALTASLRAGLAEIPGLKIIANVPFERSSGITSFVVEGWKAEQHQALVDRLYEEEAILVKFQPEFGGIRVSLACFNTSEEVDRLIDALRARCTPGGQARG